MSAAKRIPPGCRRVQLVLDTEVVEKTKQIAGLIPLSRFVQDVLEREIGRRSRTTKDESHA